ncbi:A-kinase anchor protein 13 [Larimichthys crocea]|uniref:Uncharacterized protein n=1 Tax=Larimichthys crocea TaxID=215358 RepID=A0ACD3QZZ3_LARCR|nr:A-kinase anchor protein 13 [Larimichthys crocea]
MEDIQIDLSPETMPSSSFNSHADLDSGMIRGLSSDDDDSFRSLGSSTTEIFHPSQDSVGMGDQDLMEEPNDSKPGENKEHSLTVDAGLPLEPGTVSALIATGCSQTGTGPESQLSPSLQTIEALNTEGTGEKLVPELFKEDLSLGPALSESGDASAVKVDESEAGEAIVSEHLAPDVTSRLLFEASQSGAEESETIDPVEGDHQSTETSDKSAVDCSVAEQSGDVQLLPQQPRWDNSEMTADERSPDEGLWHSENQTDVSSSQGFTPPSDVDALEIEQSSLNNKASGEPHVENETENPKSLDAVDRASQSAIQEVEVIMSEETVIGAGEEENGPTEETDSSTIHRDREASFRQPCNTLHSGSSQSSASPSLPSRTSSAASCPSTAHRDSGSDIESFLNTEPGYDSIYRKNDEPVTGGDSASEVSVSCSSTDDTASVGLPSSSPEGSQGLECSWSPEEGIQAGATITAGPDSGGGGGGAGEAEEEAKDRVTEVPRRPCILRKRSIRSLSPLRRHSWGPGKGNGGDAEMNQRSYSLEGLSGGQEDLRRPTAQGPRMSEPSRMPRQDSDDRGSLVSLTEEQEDLGVHGRLHDPKSRRYRPLRNSCPPMTLPLTKSVSMLAISQRDIDGMGSFSSTSGSLAYSISEEEPGPLRSDNEGKGVTKVSRTFSYLKNKMYKKTREKDKDKKDKEKEGKEKDKKTINGHVFTPVSSGQGTQCSHCNKAFNSKDAFLCTYCNASVHKGCRDSLPVCAKVKMKLPKQQFVVPDSSSFPAVTMRNKWTEMMDSQLMGEFEADAKELEADSWSLGVEQQYLQQLDKELVKRQDVVYELMQTEMHHIRTLRIMSDVYSKGLQKEVQLELQTVEKLFPALDELLELHTQHLFRLLERKRESQLEWGSSEGGFIISRIGDILVSQFSGSNGESMKRVYGRFCSRHNEAVNFYKDLLTKDKRFKAFIKKKMSSSIVRRLGIPECILLVTQRITKYPVLIQRMLQHTKESEEDYEDLTDAVRLVKEVIAAVDSKVNEHEKRRRLKDFHGRMDSKSIMMMKSGQMFAREDLLRRRLIHDGDQRSTVISLQKLIVREVANEERGLFLITAGIEKPEMMEVLANSKDERNTWMQLIQEAMQSMEKDEDEGIPSETEDDKRQLETKAKEMRDLLKQKDTEIMSLLEEKVQLFRGMWEGLNPSEEGSRQVEPFFRSACSLEPPRGASVMKDALQEVETLQALVNGSLGGAMASIQEGGGTGPVCLPRRAETFGGFDSHQMHSSKSGDREESEDTAGDLRRTGVRQRFEKGQHLSSQLFLTWKLLRPHTFGGNANVLLLLKRNSEQVLHSVSNLHLLLSTLQAVVVQQDSFIEDQRQALSERSSSCTSLSRQTSRPSSLIEQEKQRSLEKQRQELASLQRQQTALAEEKRRREKEWELREQHLTEREGLVHMQEEEVLRQNKVLEEEKRELQNKKEEYQRDLERLRDAQRKLERDREAVQRQLDKMEEIRLG